MKTMQLSIRGCPENVHRVLQQKAKQNRRSLNNEILTWLEKEAQRQTPVTGRELAKNMRRAQKMLTKKEQQQWAEDIETARKLMNREHLH
jgi:hypothetical protein